MIGAASACWRYICANTQSFKFPQCGVFKNSPKELNRIITDIDPSLIHLETTILWIKFIVWSLVGCAARFKPARRRKNAAERPTGFDKDVAEQVNGIFRACRCADEHKGWYYTLRRNCYTAVVYLYKHSKANQATKAIFDTSLWLCDTTRISLNQLTHWKKIERKCMFAKILLWDICRYENLNFHVKIIAERRRLELENGEDSSLEYFVYRNSFL